MSDETFHGHETAGTNGLGPGTRLGNYELREPIGRGGMGQVWKAWDREGERFVALKLLPPEFKGNDEAIKQVREAFRVVHELSHPHLGPTLGLLSDPQHGPHLVMKLVRGVPLSRYVGDLRSTQGSISAEIVVCLLRPVAEALDYAHSQGVLHRDVKPQNILVDANDKLDILQVTLIDFGLAAEIRRSLTKHTKGTLDTRGTRPYMAPEQLRGNRRDWDGRTDQYSLTAVAYELLAGNLPFESDDDMGLMLSILNDPASPIDERPASLNAVLLKSLSKLKDQRYSRCVEMIDDLARSPTTISAPKPGLPPVETSRTTGMTFALIPAGEFLMGSSEVDVKAALAADETLKEVFFKAEQPQHRVQITKPFYLGKYEVTQADYRKVTGRNPSYFSSDGGGQDNVAGLNTDRFPVERVSWFDAVAFCNGLSAADGLSPYYGLTGIERDPETQSIKAATVSVSGGNGYRLPTEAEWEYACRAGTTTPYHFGSVLNGDKANVDGNFPFGTKTDGTKLKRPTTVDDSKYALNAFGLAQMHGNVYEWCWDAYEEAAYERRGTLTSDPVIINPDDRRALRGASWNDFACDARSAYRDGDAPEIRFPLFGFRVARTP